MIYKEIFPISKIKIEAFSHATENPDKVKQAMLSIIPSHLRSKVKIRREILQGYYGNPIIILRATIRDPQIIRETISYITSKMDSLDKKLIESTLELRIDKSKNLYIRFSKEDAYYENLVLKDYNDVIKVSISFSPFIKKKELRQICKELGLI